MSPQLHAPNASAMWTTVGVSTLRWGCVEIITTSSGATRAATAGQRLKCYGRSVTAGQPQHPK